MNLTVGHIADQINGSVVGDRDIDIFNISKIEEGAKGTYTQQMHLLQLFPVILNQLKKLNLL